jgi:hypothetical protein
MIMMNFVREIAFQTSKAVSIELKHEGEGEELKVWVASFVIDEDMTEEK